MLLNLRVMLMGPIVDSIIKPLNDENPMLRTKIEGRAVEHN